MPHNLLKQKSQYFKNLSPDGQQRFVDRLYNFMEDKSFVGQEGLVLTDEIRVLISASAVQLTFGLNNYTISNLHTINVFPEIFYSKYYETSFKGLATQGGVLSLSWDDFKEGYADSEDKINLGLHELAHTLNIDWDENSSSSDEQFIVHYEHWKIVATEHFEQVKQGSLGFFREYAGQNLHEFFAVCVEHFFEVPKDFKQKLPHLYGHTVLMLNQDPENVINDYKVKDVAAYFEKGETGSSRMNEEPDKNRQDLAMRQLIHHNTPLEAESGDTEIQEGFIPNFIRTQGVYVAMATTFAGLFVGIPMLFWFSNVILVDVGALFLLIFLCGGIGLFQWRFVKDHIDMHYHQFAMYAFTGFGMCMVNFLLFLNLNISIDSRAETYDMNMIHINERNLNVRVGDSETNPLAKNLTSFLQKNFVEIPEAKKIVVFYKTGLLGFDVIENCEFN